MPAVESSGGCPYCDRQVENCVYLPSFDRVGCRLCVMSDPANADEGIQKGY